MTQQFSSYIYTGKSWQLVFKQKNRPWTFTAVPFTTARRWKRLNIHQLVNGRDRATERKMTQPSRGMVLWHIRQHSWPLKTLRKVKEATQNKATRCTVPLVSNSQNSANPCRPKADSWLPGAAGLGEWGVTASWLQDFLLGWRKTSGTRSWWCLFAQHCECAKCHSRRILHIRYILSQWLKNNN